MKWNRGRNRRAQELSEQEAPPSGLARMLDIPASAVSHHCQMEISGNREVIVDGCQGVLEYTDTVIKLATGKMSIKFTGRGLQIRVLTHTSAVVEGFLTGIEFST